jgi:glyoxylase-like metal-dependent hydrolase (beta-lactamase superfamily II)
MNPNAHPEPPPFDLRRFTLGPFETNAYVVRPHHHPGCWVIDAPFDAAPLVNFLREQATRAADPVRPEALLLTHAHADHIAGADDLRRAFPGLPTLIHSAETSWLTDPQANLSGLSGFPITVAPATGTLADNQTLTLGESRWRVLHTPGHSPGGVSFVLENPARGTPPLCFAGDTLFLGSIGRHDFPGSSRAALFQSIRQRLYTLDPSTILLPGHGPQTTIAAERESNPFVRP